MTPFIIALPHNESLAARLASELGGELGQATLRRFPDDESYVRIHTDVIGRPVILVCTLDHPDDKALQLLFLAATARELGAESVDCSIFALTETVVAESGWLAARRSGAGNIYKLHAESFLGQDNLHRIIAGQRLS